MSSKATVLGWIVVCASANVLAGQASNAPLPALSATEIASRNAVARGGLQAWLKVQTLSESGTLTAGGDQRRAASPEVPGVKHPIAAKPMPASPRLKQEARLPFVMEMQRPRKVRLEVTFKGENSVQVYDGTNGWKFRPFLNRSDVEPYTQNELKLASMQPDLDGPLMNYAAKGTRVELDGTEKVDGQDTYKLKLTMKDGTVTHIWINGSTFLEATAEGQPRKLDGREHPVEIYYRDFHKVDGLEFPFLLETRVLPLKPASAKAPVQTYSAEQVVIERVDVNPKLASSRFEKPQGQVAAIAPDKR